MPPLPKALVTEVVERTDIVALVSRWVTLKASGASFRGLCPFHKESTPSFDVDPTRRRFRCFGCQKSGDAIEFLRLMEGSTFPAAVQQLAEAAGVDLGMHRSFRDLNRPLHDALAIAHEHFRSCLSQSLGATAREYLEARGVNADSVERFGLGWAPDEWAGLAAQLSRRGMVQAGDDVGLTKPRPGNRGRYDFFRSRLMVPLRRTDGRLVAFAGRLVGSEHGPKYLNSPESVLFKKGALLFGLDVARAEVRRSGTAVLVEGYFDVIALHQGGVRNAVGLSSTALTALHLSELRAVGARNLVLLLDGDRAGAEAVERQAGPLLSSSLPSHVAALPAGDDPDTFIVREGPERLNALLGAATALTAHLFARILPEGPEAPFEAKVGALQRLAPIASHLSDEFHRGAFLSALARHFGLPEQSLATSLPPPRPLNQ